MRHKAWFGIVWTAAWLVLAAVPGAVARADTATPEPVGDIAARLQAVDDAFRAVADRSAGGAWQAADEAYNGALDALDAHRGPLEGALGDEARLVFARVDELLPALVAALDAEDVARVGATVALMQATVRGLAPGADAAAPSANEIQRVLAWRQQAQQARSLFGVAAWRDARNAAIDLVADVASGGPSVARAAGEGAQEAVDIVRVFAMRLIAAAQNQAPADAEAANAAIDAASQDLLRRLGALPTPVPASVPDVRMRFRGAQVPGNVGDTVVVPIVADGVPQVGLGAFDLVARWSPGALRLVDVTWDVAPGTIIRDDPGGSVGLSLPPAPTGPSGTANLARLSFEVLAGAVSGADYLPADEVASITDAVAEARSKVREGDMPRAASALQAAYFRFVSGRDQPGSLYALLNSDGLAEPVHRILLSALDVTSQPAETDIVLLTLADLDQTLAATWGRYLAVLAPLGGVPIALEVRSALDTTGQPLPWLPPEPGQVVTAGALPVPAAITPMAGGAGGSVATTPSGGADPAVTPPAGAGVSGAPDREATAAGGAAVAPPPGAPRFPLALVLALAVAAVLGVAALLIGDRGDADGAE